MLSLPYKLLILALGAICIFLGISVVSLRTLNNSLMETNGKLTSEISELRSNIDLQNKAIGVMEERTAAYRAKLAEAKTRNEESQKKLEKSLEEIRVLKLPKDCDGKVEVLKQELMKSATGWKLEVIESPK
jgi:predicted RND superfamily exporter protein